MEIKDQSAVVTGGGSGLGEATARALASAGAKVAIFDIDENKGKAVASQISGVFAKVDVSNAESIQSGLEVARSAHGQERIMVNCAGIAWAEKTASRSKSDGRIKAHDFAAFQRVLNINLLGSFACASMSAAGMMELDPLGDAGRGVIINTASVAAQDGQVGQVAYAASKGGVVGMTLPIARDLAREQIRCCTILPGFFQTPIYDTLPPEVAESLKRHLLFPPRFGAPSEYADFVLTLCRTDYINAECIRLDAGARMPPR